MSAENNTKDGDCFYDLEIRNNWLYIDGEPVKSYYRFELSSSEKRGNGDMRLTLELPVRVKGLNA